MTVLIFVLAGVTALAAAACAFGSAWRRTDPFALAFVLDPESTSPESMERVASAQLLAGTLSPARYREIAGTLAAATAQPAELQPLA